MMNEQKQNMIDSWRIRAQIYYLFNGLKNIAKDKRIVIASSIYVVVCITIRYFFSLDNSPNGFGRKWLFTLVTIGALVIFIYYKGKPIGAGRMMRCFIRIGFVSHVGETPLLMDKKIENGTYYLTFRNVSSIPLSQWQDKREFIESGLNLNITEIKERGKKYIVITAVSGENILPDFIEWDDSYLPYKNFELALGESYTGEVEVNLAVTPHILLAGSTGSGKTILLKLLLMQSLKKGAEVYIADFKGGVDFPRIWHNHDKCIFITDKDDLKNKLDEIVIELHRRKALLSDSDCKDIDEYNYKLRKNLHRIIFACDELAEVTEKAGLEKKQKELVSLIEASLSTILRLGRAMGIHAFLSTQRPSRDVIPGVVVNNSDVRICGRADNVLSQIILDKVDAADLISKNAQGRFLTNDDVLFQAYWFDDSKL